MELNKTTNQVSTNINNKITLDLTMSSAAELLTTINQLPHIYTKYSVSILNRRVNESLFRLICSELIKIGLKPLDLTYDTWGKGITVLTDLKANRTIAIPFNNSSDAEQFLTDTYLECSSANLDMKDRLKGFPEFKAEYSIDTIEQSLESCKARQAARANQSRRQFSLRKAV